MKYNYNETYEPTRWAVDYNGVKSYYGRQIVPDMAYWEVLDYQKMAEDGCFDAAFVQITVEDDGEEVWDADEQDYKWQQHVYVRVYAGHTMLAETDCGGDTIYRPQPKKVQDYRLIGRGGVFGVYKDYADAQSAATMEDSYGSGWEFDVDVYYTDGTSETLEHHLGY